MQKFQIGKNEQGQRFDKYLKKLLPEAPGSFIYKMLRKKNITLNNQKAEGDKKLNLGDEVALFLSEETFSKFSKRPSKSQKNYPSIPLDIIYEDQDIIAINKPVGMLSQKAKATDISANEYIIGYLLQKQELTEAGLQAFRPSICNRLDRNTSGVLIAGKSLQGLQGMARQLGDRSVKKHYLCLACGKVRTPRTLEGWLQKDGKNNQGSVTKEALPDSKYIRTSYDPLEWFSIKGQGDFTLLEVSLETGRSHQIRAQLASVGHPILGDPKYGDRKANVWGLQTLQVRSQLLHACWVGLADGKEFKAPVNGVFQKALGYFRQHPALNSPQAGTGEVDKVWRHGTPEALEAPH